MISLSYPLSVNDYWNKEWLFIFRAFIGPLITSRVNLLSSEFFFRMKLNLVPRQLWFSMYLLFFCIYIFCVNNVKWYDNGNQSSAFKSVSSFSIIPELKIVLTKNSKLREGFKKKKKNYGKFHKGSWPPPCPLLWKKK